MSFVSSIWTGRLSEKPWKADAVLRLIGSIVICMLMGGLASAVISSLKGPQNPHEFLFLAVISGAFVCFVITLLMLRREWSFEDYLRKLLTCMVCVYAGFALMWWAGNLQVEKSEVRSATVRILIGVGAFQGMAILLVHFFLREQKLTWTEAFGFHNETLHSLLLGACAVIVVLPVVRGLQAISILVLERLTFQPHEQETVHLLRTADTWPNRIVLGVATIVVAPLAEEILFRGILYPWIKRVKGPELALWTTSILFGVIHLDLPTLLPLIFLAVVLACLYEYTGNLLACIATHSVFNAANFIALYYYPQ